MSEGRLLAFLILHIVLTFALSWSIEDNIHQTVQIDNVQQCLSNSQSKHHGCNVSTIRCHINQKDCLTTIIPPNTFSYTSIRCCLWCCLQYHAKTVQADITDFLFTPDGLGNPREVKLTKRSVLKKIKFSFFAVKSGSFREVPTTPKPNAVVLVSTNKAAEYEYQHKEVTSSSSASSDTAALFTETYPWILRSFSSGAVTSSAEVVQSDHSLGGGVYLLPRGVTNPAAAEEALLFSEQNSNIGKKKDIAILCLVDNEGEDHDLDLNIPEYAFVRNMNWQCQQLPQNKADYYKLLLTAEFVLVLQHIKPRHSDRSLHSRHPQWIYDAMLCDAVPIIGPWIAGTVTRFLTLNSAPLLSVTDDAWRNTMKYQDIDKGAEGGFASSIQRIRDLYRAYTASKEPQGLSISLLFFPFWLDKLADISHVGRVAPASLLGEYTKMDKIAKLPPHRLGQSRVSSQQTGMRLKSRRSNPPTSLNPQAFRSSRVECSPTVWKPHDTFASTFEVELVLPRCCEPLEDLEWLQKLLQAYPQFKVKIYYRCPFCLPQEKAIEWLPLINSDSILREKVFNAGGGVLLTDFTVGSDKIHRIRYRIQQLPLFDTRSNGKEFVPFLHHIVQNYHSALADFTIFLHTIPSDHIKTSSIFDRSVNYLAKCKPNGAVNSAFWFVNQRMFEGNFWSNCHGCTECLYHYWTSFIDPNITLKDFVSMPKQAYNAAQFVASKQAILSRPAEWWDLLLAVTNSSLQDLSKCPLPKNWNDGGNKAGLALERMWHVIFNRPPLLPFRKDDMTLPPALRIE